MIRVNLTDPDLNETLADSGGNETYSYKGKPFTGLLVISCYPNGQIESETEYVNGFEQGVSRDYFENGQLETEIFTKYNVLYGFSKHWDSNGNLISQVDNGPEPNW